MTIKHDPGGEDRATPQAPTVSLQEIRALIQAADGPQFMLPARFANASFEAYQVDPTNPSQASALAETQAFIERANAGQPSLRFWQRRQRPASSQRGLYLVGPPGTGKTHLLAAAYREAAEPRIFATFDELAAAAGTMGMRGLAELLANQRAVCIDEIDLDDPASIMLLVSLLQIMLDGDPSILATANARPDSVTGGHGVADQFERELGSIAGAFMVVPLEGEDWRQNPEARQRPDLRHGPTANLTWEELIDLLWSSHPMYDAAWLRQVQALHLDRVAPLGDTDEAIRFVRFIDRVYDRAVALAVDESPPALEMILRPISQDGRYPLHYARCRSRLAELLAGQPAVAPAD